jgi:hypothetical protein
MSPFRVTYTELGTKKIIDEASHWRDQAENTRSAAEHFIDPKSKCTMLGIAETYEHLSVRAEQRAAKDSGVSQTVAEPGRGGAWQARCS